MAPSATTSSVPSPAAAAKKLPVTLLSGFLGSGKTTLLEHILRNKSGLRCAVIVNDMAELNIDATLIANKNVMQVGEKMVQMQNGCICCTLREDLLVEVARLARSRDFDYLVIESTGISEPMQVAETFTFEASQDDTKEGDDMKEDDGNESPEKAVTPSARALEGLRSLSDIAYLDTCVTVVDAFNFLDTFSEFRTVAETDPKATEEDDRNIVDLMVDQIEFADVIILNKVDRVSTEQATQITTILRSINTTAEIICSSYSKVDLNSIMGTGRFDMEKASKAPGWLKSLTEPHTPETAEYGVGHFVYRARRPFHPDRLGKLIVDNFILEEYSEPKEGNEEDTNEDEDDNDEGSGMDVDSNGEDNEEYEAMSEVEDDENEEEVANMMGMDDEQRELWRRKRVAAKNAGPFRGVLRSKGFTWLPSRNSTYGEWSQAGVILSYECGGPWMSEIPRSDWPEHSIEAILADYEGAYEDRRQEIVFIGIEMDVAGITAELSKCLLNDKEWEQFNSGRRRWVDPFEPWPTAQQLLAESMVVGDEGENSCSLQRTH